MIKDMAVHLEFKRTGITPIPDRQNWITRFRKRHPPLALKLSIQLECQSAYANDPDILQDYLEKLGRLIRQYGLRESQIYNKKEKGFMMGLGTEQAKQERGRARGAEGKEERDKWCRSRGSVDKSRSMKELEVCLFRLLCDRDSSVRLGTRIYISEIPWVVVLRPSTPFQLRRKEYCGCVRNIRRCGGRSSTDTSWWCEGIIACVGDQVSL